jgi:hypothetical protein
MSCLFLDILYLYYVYSYTLCLDILYKYIRKIKIFYLYNIEWSFHTVFSLIDKEGYPCLVPQFSPKFHYAKRRFSVTSKCRQMHGVLNVDEIKN